MQNKKTFYLVLFSKWQTREEMFRIGISSLRINFCITPVLGFVMLATTFFQTINRPAPSIIITVLRQIIFLVPFIYILPILLEINGIFFAQPISDLLATALSVLLVLKEKKRMMCNSVLS